VEPFPVAAGLIVPEMLKVGTGWAVKLTPDALAPLMVLAALGGVKVNPAFDGVTVYEPFTRALKA
jgi:hypothetical protein